MKLKKIKQRIRLFFLPYLLLNTIFLVVYTLIVWYFYIRNGRIHQINDSNILYFIPGICSLVLMSVFVTPRLRFVIFLGGNITGMIAFTVLPAITMMITTAAANTYLRDRATPVVHLKSLDEFGKQQLSGFYTFENIALDQEKHILDWGVRGKKNNKLYITLITACRDSFNSNYNFWILEERDSFLGMSIIAENAYSELRNDLQAYLDTVDYSKIAYFERSVFTENHQRVTGLIHKVTGDRKTNIVFKPNFKPLKERLSKESSIALMFYFGGNIIWLLLFASARVSTLKLYDHERKKQQSL